MFLSLTLVFLICVAHDALKLARLRRFILTACLIAVLISHWAYTLAYPVTPNLALVSGMVALLGTLLLGGLAFARHFASRRKVTRR